MLVCFCFIVAKLSFSRERRGKTSEMGLIWFTLTLPPSFLKIYVDKQHPTGLAKLFRHKKWCVMKKLQCHSVCHEDCLSVSEWPWRLCPHFHFSMSNSFSVMFEQSVLFALQYWSKWLFTCTNTSQWIIHKNKHLAPRLKPFHFAISKAGRFFLRQMEKIEYLIVL